MRRLPATLGLLTALIAGPAAAGGPYQITDNALVVPHAVVYKTGKPALDAKKSAAALSFVAGYLADKTYISKLRIEVHADAAGDDAANQALTEQRALQVARALVATGVDCKRLLPVGFGESKPVADNNTPAGRAANRRTTFVNAELRGRAIGGMPIDGGGVVAGDPCE